MSVFAKINTLEDAHKYIEPSNINDYPLDIDAAFEDLKGGWYELIEYFYPKNILDLDTNATLDEIKAKGEKIIIWDQDEEGNFQEIMQVTPEEYEDYMEAPFENIKENKMKKQIRESEEIGWDGEPTDLERNLQRQYLPDHGEGDTMATQAVTAVCKIVYRYYNDGDVFDNNYGLKGWANDLSSYANWLDENIPEAAPILAKIQEIGKDEAKYTILLHDLVTAVINPETLEKYAAQPSTGSVYDCDGPYEFTVMPTCPECGQECEQWDIDHYGMCSDCYNSQDDYEDEEEEEFDESKKLTSARLHEARKAKKKEHKAYKMKEDEEAEWSWDLKTEKKALRKSMPAASDNEITIKAAGNIAKKYHTTRSKILATLKPSNNIKGAKTWNKDGKVLVKESVDPNADEIDNGTVLTDYQKDVIKEMVQADFECGHTENDYNELVQLMSEDEDFAGAENEAASYYMELLSYGPAGFLEAFRDELDFDPDFIAEYGDPDYDEDDYIGDEDADSFYDEGDDDATGPVPGSIYDETDYGYEDDEEPLTESEDPSDPYFYEENLPFGDDYDGPYPSDDYYEDDIEHDMGEMYGAPHGASPEEALKFFEAKDEDDDEDDCKGKSCKSKKEKLDEISEEDLGKIIVAYRASDPDRKPIKDSKGRTYSVAYNEDKPAADQIESLKRLIRKNNVPESMILNLRFRKISA